MANYVLFKQLVCLIFIGKMLVLLPQFYRYFGPPSFPRSIFNTPFRTIIFNLFLITDLILLFLNIYPLVTSFFLFLCMRYLYITDRPMRLTSAAAVGFICYFVATYLFIFELGQFLDSSLELNAFLLRILGYEIAIIMFMSVIYKVHSGYITGKGFEYGLVNPMWSKFFFLLRKIPPSSLFFKANNLLALTLQLSCGTLFLFNATSAYAATLLIVTFIYVFLSIRTSVLPFLMMSLSLLFLPPLSMHFPTLDYTTSLTLDIPILTQTLQAVFILYLIILIIANIYLAVTKVFEVKFPRFIEKPIESFILYRPVFEWMVFTSPITDFFVKIETVSKDTGKVESTLFDGYSHGYLDAIKNPKLFFRFIHHHESSTLLNVFYDYKPKARIPEEYFHSRIIKYAKTLIPQSEAHNIAIQFTIVQIEKTPTYFEYIPFQSYIVDLESDRVITMKKAGQM